MTWDDLARELDAWAAAGKRAEFWWRDDDAVAATPALDRLLAVSQRHAVRVMLAVIPARAEASLAARLANAPLALPVQHGWAHQNHAGPGRAKAELGADRPPGYVLGELSRGALLLDCVLGPGWVRVLVPPHNRIAAGIAAGLAAAGYVGLSTHQPRGPAPPGLIQVNTHVDIMEWSKTRAFLGESECLELAVAHLAGKRAGRFDPTEPTGLLTHHLAHDEAAWRFADEFVGRIRAHRGAAWLDPRELFARRRGMAA